MKVLLVCPEDPPPSKLQRIVAGSTLPLGLAYLAASVRAKGHKVSVLDNSVEELGLEAFGQRVAAEAPDVLGISTTTPTIRSCFALAAKAKETCPGLHVVMGGTHATALPKECLKDTNVDVVVIGEGEETLVELMECFQGAKPLSDVKGILYRENGQIITTGKRPVQTNIDLIPLPARDLFDLDKYGLAATRKGLPGRSSTITVSRGCPFDCVFCSNVVHGRQIRYRSAANVVEEIEILTRDYDVREMLIVDDTFTMNKKRVIEVCQLILQRGIHISWGCHSRVDTIDDEMASAMKSAGCRQIAFGIESGCQTVLDSIGKKITLDQARRTVKLCRKHGIRVLCSFMFGHELDTRETAEATIKFAIELDPDMANFWVLTPFPGSKVYDLARERGLLEESAWDDYVAFSTEMPVIEFGSLTKRELVSLQKEAIRRFYFRPRYLVRRLLGLRSLEELRQGLRGLWFVMLHQIHWYHFGRHAAAGEKHA